MNTKNLVEAVAAKAGLSVADVEPAVKATLETIRAQVAAGERVILAGFGTFEVRERAGADRTESADRRDHADPRRTDPRLPGGVRLPGADQPEELNDRQNAAPARENRTGAVPSADAATPERQSGERP